MSQLPGHQNPPVSPPPNRAIGWYRFMLWLMPTCVAITTAIGFVWLSSQLRLNGNLMVLGWFVLNILATHCFAVFDAKLRNRPDHPVSLKTDAGWIHFLLL